MTREPQGLLVVDKPRGPTSHDVVAEARRLYATRQVGHAGTLDPMATGVLLLLFGEATKLCPYLLLDRKRYRARVRFGTSTNTLDACGQIVEARELEPGWLEPEALAEALAAETARTRQVPPAYSALKVGGQRAHDLARQGRSPGLAPRPVEVFSLRLLEANEREAALELFVGKGYYVRAFARDLGQRLGVPAHLCELVRTASGCFDLAEARRWPLHTPSALMPISEIAARVLPLARLTPAGVHKARRGQRLMPADFDEYPPAESTTAWLDGAGDLVALGQADSSGSLFVIRGFGGLP